MSATTNAAAADDPSSQPPRPSRIVALSEAPIPSAVLGVHAVLDTLAASGACELRTGSTVASCTDLVAWSDVVLLVRGASPAEKRILIEAQRLGRKVATYLDDDLERVPGEARSGYFFTSPHVRANVAFIVQHADAVLVCSDRLGTELAARHGVKPLLVRQPRPPRVPGEGTEPPSGNAIRPADRVRVGFLGSVDHAAFLDALLGAPLRELRRELGDRLELVFCGALPEIARELGAHCEPFEPDFVTWRRRARELALDVGLAPLPDTPFHRNKYFNKYLEYGSLGVAGIYSDVPPSADAVRDGDTGLLCANDAAAWLAALRRLTGDRELRARIARAAWLDIEARFSSTALLPAWTATLALLLDHRAPDVAPGAVRLPGGALRHALDRLAVYGPLRFAERVAGRLSGRLRPG
jgi:glycosyltransferase involved in cell wall biosynthesis